MAVHNYGLSGSQYQHSWPVASKATTDVGMHSLYYPVKSVIILCWSHCGPVVDRPNRPFDFDKNLFNFL